MHPQLSAPTRRVRTTDTGNFRPTYHPHVAPSPAAKAAPHRHDPAASPAARDRLITITFSVYEQHAPALRSAVEELGNIIGSRLEGSHSFAREQALTDASIAVHTARAAINKLVPVGDPYYAQG